jgi:hypothetical protein
MTLAVLLALFSAGLIFAPAPQTQDAFAKLAFGALIGLAAFIQQQPQSKLATVECDRYHWLSCSMKQPHYLDELAI